MTISISKQQMKMLEPFALDNYISELIIHCDSSFPHFKKMMGEEKLRSVLKECIIRAERSGFTQRGPVQFYIDMMIMFGSGFETDPQYPWVAETLKQNIDLSQIEQADALFFKANEYLQKISGENNKYEYSVAEKLINFDLSLFKVIPKNFEQQMAHMLKDIYPQKAQTMSESSLQTLISTGIKYRHIQYPNIDLNHQSLQIISMYLYGHQFDTDPFLSPALFSSMGHSGMMPLEKFIQRWSELKVSY